MTIPSKELKLKIAQSLYDHEKYCEKSKAASIKYDQLDRTLLRITNECVNIAREASRNSTDENSHEIFTQTFQRAMTARQAEIDDIENEMKQLSSYGEWIWGHNEDGEEIPEIDWDYRHGYDWEESDYRNLDITNKDWIEIQGYIAELKQRESELNSTGVSSNYDYEI